MTIKLFVRGLFYVKDSGMTILNSNIFPECFRIRRLLMLEVELY